MAAAIAILWALAVLVPQCTCRVFDRREVTEHPKPITLVAGGRSTEYPKPMTLVNEQTTTEDTMPLNDELTKEQMFIENFEDTNPDKVGDKELFQADILLTDEQWEALLTRKALNYSQYRWPEGSDGFPFVPYVFQGSVNKNDVRAGINHWMENTCLKFGETTNTSQPHIQFHIGSGCWSYIGMLYFKNGQQISIGRGCNSLGVVAHEIGHAMGFYHEQSRSDRNDYIVINSGNIISGREGNFGKASDNNYSVAYDYSSVMHYSSRGFTTNGGFTIATTDPLAHELIGSRSGLSHRDILLANKMYGCLDKWLASCNISSNPCKNEGFIGAKCKCICPVHTSGTNCQKDNKDYYAHLRSNKTEVITTKGTISVNTSGLIEKFTKYIVAPKGQVPKLTFKTFKLYSKSTFSNGDSFCYYEYLNIRTGEDLYDGDMYCATDISSGTVFKSSTREMILFTESRYYGSSYWSAKLTFEDDSDSTSTTMTTSTMTSTTTAPAYVNLKCKNKKKEIRVQKGETVMFTSPNFSQDYPKKSSCGWILKKPTDGKFIINCSTFALQKKKGGCKDYLKVAGKMYCGKVGPVNKIIKNNKVYIHFASNGKKEYKGFSCTATVKSSKSNTVP